GRFRIPDLSDTPYDVVLYAPEDADRSQPRARVERVRAGGAELELVARVERRPSAYLMGRILDPDGKPVRPKSIWGRREDELGSVGAPEWSEDERFRLGPLLSGSYQLSFSVEGFPGSRLDVVLAEGEERDLGDIVLARPGHARITMHGRDGLAIPRTLSAFLQDSHLLVSRLESADGSVFESEPLFPGPYELFV